MISIQNSIHLCPDKIVWKGAEKLLFSKFLVQFICITCMQVNLKHYNAWWKTGYRVSYYLVYGYV